MEIQRTVDDMFETIHGSSVHGFWLQRRPDIHQRHHRAIDVPENRDERPVLINPELLEVRRNGYGKAICCLSIPEQRALVPRAEQWKTGALDRDGNPFELEADGLLAIGDQHEMDHLVGKLFIDYLSPKLNNVFVE